MTDASVSRAPKSCLIACMVAAGTAALLASIFLANLYRSEPHQASRLAHATPPPVIRETSIAKSARTTKPLIETALTPQAVAPPATEGVETPKPKSAPGFKPETGRASWYDLASATASGETMDGDDLTAAHPTLPIGTRVLVENLDNGRSVIVRINDRGPFTRNRIIDVSRAAAEKLGMVAKGVAHVRVSRIDSIEASISASQ